MANEILMTDVDRLVDIVKDKKLISIKDVAKELNVSTSTIESWASFLEEEGLVKIQYKLTKPYLKYLDQKPVVPQEIRTDRDDEGAEDVQLKKVMRGGRETTIYEISNPRATVSAEKRVEGELSEDVDEKLASVTQKMAEAKQMAKRVEKQEKFVKKMPLDVAKKPFVELPKADMKKVVEPEPVSKLALQEGKKADAVKLDMVLGSFDVEESKDAADAIGSSKKKAKDDKRPQPTEKEFAKKDEIVDKFKSMFDKAEEEIAQKHYKTAKEIYADLKKEISKLPDKFVERKREYYYDLIKLNKDIFLAVDKELSYDVTVKSNDIDKLLKKAKESIKHDDYQQSQKLLKDATEVFKKLPTGFLKKRATMQEKLNALHDDLIKTRVKRYQRVMNKKSLQIESMLKEADKAVEKEEIKKADKIFSDIKELFITLPEGFIDKRTKLEEKILALHETLLQKKVVMATKDSANLLMEIEAALRLSEKKLRAGDLKPAESLLEKAKDDFMKLPEGFIQRKSVMESEIIRINNEIVKENLKLSSNRAEKIIKSIRKMIKRIDHYLKKKQPDMANNYYSEALAEFNNMPEGFLEDKTEIQLELSEIYKRIITSLDMELLSQAGVSVNKKYEEMLHLIVELHQDIEAKNFEVLEITYKRIVEVFNKLPVGFVSHRPKIRDEILSLHDKIELYRKAKSLENYVGDTARLRKKISEINYLKSKLKDTSEDPALLDYVNQRCLKYGSIAGGHKRIPKYQPSELEQEKEKLMKRRAKRDKDRQKILTKTDSMGPELPEARKLERNQLMSKYKGFRGTQISDLEKTVMPANDLASDNLLVNKSNDKKDVELKSMKSMRKSVIDEAQDDLQVKASKREASAKISSARQAERERILAELNRVRELKRAVHDRRMALLNKDKHSKDNKIDITKRAEQVRREYVKPEPVIQNVPESKPEPKEISAKSQRRKDRRNAFKTFKKVNFKPDPVTKTQIVEPERAVSRDEEREVLMRQYGVHYRGSRSFSKPKKTKSQQRRAEARENFRKDISSM